MIIQRYRLELFPHLRLDINMAMHSKQKLMVHVLPQDRQFRRVPVTGTIRQILDLDA